MLRYQQRNLAKELEIIGEKPKTSKALVVTLFLREQSVILLFAKNQTRIEAVSIRQTLWRCTFPNK
jgi:hypothetical protein